MQAHSGGGEYMDAAAQRGVRYEAPRLTAIGSVKDVTLGEGIWGSDDTFVFHWGPFNVTIPYGNLS